MSPDSLRTRRAATRSAHVAQAAVDPFDRLARLAAAMASAPRAAVVLLNGGPENPLTLAGRIGFDETSAPRALPFGDSICQYVLASREPLVIDDARQHALVRDVRMMAGGDVAGFIAIPVIGARDDALGALIVADPSPRRWRSGDVQGLEDLAFSVAAEIAAGPSTSMRVAIPRSSGEQRLASEAELIKHRRAEEALRESEERFRAMFEQAAVGMAHVDLNGAWMRVNQRLCDIVGFDHDELLARSVQSILHPEDVVAHQEQMRRMTSGEISTSALEHRYLRKDGTVIWATLTLSLMRQTSGAPKYFIAIFEDITQRKQLELQFFQSQRLEAVGLLAGGVAHDFNNLLTAITGYSDALLDAMEEADERRTDVRQIRRAAEHAAALTAQLLAFSRKQVLRPKVLDLSAVVVGMDSMLRRLIGEDIDLHTFAGSEAEIKAGRVRADPAQVEQVVMNLVVNARDAMPDGGRITIETANIDLGESYAHRHVSFVPGKYVMLAVTDTGCGMDKETEGRVFEPFFTTKGPGKGTGLGLSTVYGIVKQSGGYIWVYSEIGHGTTFKMYLPRVEDAVDVPRAPEPPKSFEMLRGTETILLVEDEDSLRTLINRMLSKYGYSVLEARHGREALAICEAYKGRIHVVVTDVVMPEMGGRELVDRLVSLRTNDPPIRVLFMSGYPGGDMVRRGVLDAQTAFLQKPLTLASLARKIREILD
ncbi:MAG: PAS domain S-box protein [Gemmatimonadota bacterium]|nr:PAS domain S-box protein [Gemmatimonadota bacterium]